MPSTGYVDTTLLPGLVERVLASGEIRHRSIGYFDGTQTLETWKGLTRTEAKKRHEARRVDINEGVRPARDITVGELVDEAYAHYQSLINRAGSNGKKPPISQPVLNQYVKMWPNRIETFAVGTKSFRKLKVAEV